MEKNLQFSEEPKVTPWGNDMSNVPLNVKEETVKNDNGKDEQTTIIDSVQRLGSKLASLHTSFASGSKVARKQKASEEDLTERIAELQAQLAALRGEKKQG